MYKRQTAENAESASEKIKIIKFDLIILDIMMPGRSGLEFIYDHKKDLDTPIILLTAKGEASERVEGLELGADDYLGKPFEPKELILRIKNISRHILPTQYITHPKKLGEKLFRKLPNGSVLRRFPCFLNRYLWNVNNGKISKNNGK